MESVDVLPNPAGELERSPSGVMVAHRLRLAPRWVLLVLLAALAANIYAAQMRAQVALPAHDAVIR
jgi:hypothetical protein